ncbi:hypothetical protein [Planococcus dechangensis]|uniref:Uncharacterized protein n=1 Tax=Planococcus dechangensis TaxID=1176255 RepID=A0ABV9MAL9_9BACL
MTVEELIAELEKVPNKKVKVFANHNVNTDKGHGYHKKASEVTEIYRNSNDVVIETDFIEIKANIPEDFFNGK